MPRGRRVPVDFDIAKQGQAKGEVAAVEARVSASGCRIVVSISTSAATR
jgi:hypothetical protein